MDDPLLIEQTEIAAWKDLIDAAPDSFKLVNGLRYRYIGGGLAINFQTEPVPLFNRVIGLGLAETLTPVDAPVPGVMTADCNPDFAIWKRAIRDCLKENATLFVADIELPDKEKNKAAYEGFKELGFHIPYIRYHYTLKK